MTTYHYRPGSDPSRPQLGDIIDRLGPRDVLSIHAFEDLATHPDLLWPVVERIVSRGARIEVRRRRGRGRVISDSNAARACVAVLKRSLKADRPA